MLSQSKVSENAMIKYHNNKNQRIAFVRFAGFLVSNKTVLKSASPLLVLFCLVLLKECEGRFALEGQLAREGFGGKLERLGV